MPELSLDDQARIVSSFLDGLVAAFGLEATTSWEHTDDENTEVRVEGPNLGLLVGPKGRTLQAVTEVARSVVVRHGEGGSTGRVHVDVAGYRQRRREALARFTVEVADEVRSSGVARALEAMSAADRKVVHDTVASLDGVGSTSEGEEPYRRVVIVPA
jgi:spoIIIJ-associated protein